MQDIEIELRVKLGKFANDLLLNLQERRIPHSSAEEQAISMLEKSLQCPQFTGRDSLAIQCRIEVTHGTQRTLKENLVISQTKSGYAIRETGNSFTQASGANARQALLNYLTKRMLMKQSGPWRCKSISY
jgi:hypothetical protein